MKFEMSVPNMYFLKNTQEVFDLLKYKANIANIGANTIMEEFTDKEHGSRFPSMVDKLNRPIDGKDVIYVRSHSTFKPNLELYKNTNITPPPALHDHDILKDAITKGQQEGIKFTIMDATLAIPPQTKHDKGVAFGYPYWAVVDDEFKCVRIDGKYISGVESKSCPNNPNVREYIKARIRDIVEHYPEIDAFYFDHLEFPTYTFEDNFNCFCEHCMKEAERKGVELKEIKEKLYPYYEKIEHLTEQELSELLSHEAFIELSHFKWECIKDIAIETRETIKDASNNKIKFGITGFTPAFSLFGSRNYEEIGDLCDIVLPKFYPEHWTVVMSLWIKKLCSNNSLITEKQALRVIYQHLGWDGQENLPDDASEINADDKKLLPMSLVDFEAKRTIKLVNGKAEIRPTIHGWGSLENWQKKIEIITKNKIGAYIWGLFHINDEQMEIIRQATLANKG